MTAYFADPVSRRDLLKLGLWGITGAWVDPPRLLPEASRSAGTQPNKAIRFGLNYVPRKNWWYCWQDWDSKSIAEDFRAIADLGMDHIRIQCLWPVFQPAENYVSSVALGRTTELLDLAGRSYLDVEITVLTGWLSGFPFLPAWVSPLTPDQNIFKTGGVIAAEKQLFKSLTETIGKHENFLGFDLGNEINVLHDFGNPASVEESDRWAVEILDYAKQIAPGKFHVNGLDESPWFSDSGFSRSCAGTAGAASIVHCYAYFTGALKRYPYNAVGNLHLLEYMVELAKAYHVDLSRQVWVEEFGASGEWMPPVYIPDYTTQLVRNALSCGNIWGFTWWCSHDIDPALQGFETLEYSLGVLDRHNQIKPVGKALMKLAEETRKSPPRPVERSVALIVPDGKFPGAGAEAGWVVATQFMELVANGVHPAIVLRSRSQEEAYLRARGIKKLIALKAV